MPEMERFGKFEIVRELGSGGIAKTYLVKDEGAPRLSVLKVFHPELCSNREFVETLKAGMARAANLSHRNIAAIYEFGKLVDAYFSSSEYVRGVNLEEVLAVDPDEPLPRSAAAYALSELCSALQYAHSFSKPEAGITGGVVHGNLHPRNVLLSNHAEVKILDFCSSRESIEGRRRPEPQDDINAVLDLVEALARAAGLGQTELGMLAKIREASTGGWEAVLLESRPFLVGFDARETKLDMLEHLAARFGERWEEEEEAEAKAMGGGAVRVVKAGAPQTRETIYITRAQPATPAEPLEKPGEGAGKREGAGGLFSRLFRRRR